MVLGTGIANTVTGGGAILTSVKGGKISKIFSTVSLAVDAVIIPANIFALVYGVYALYNDVGALSVLIFIIAASAILLAVASLILNIVCLTRTKKAVISEPSAIDV